MDSSKNQGKSQISPKSPEDMCEEDQSAEKQYSGWHDHRAGTNPYNSIIGEIPT
jgi:hypothetical protein